MRLMSGRINSSGHLCLIVWAPVLGTRPRTWLPMPPANLHVGDIGARWAAAPNAEGQQNRGFQASKRGVGGVGVKIDRYVVGRHFSGIREGESPRVAFTPCEP
jgi:hypothetical protein